eukprot:c14092_g1_i2.p1 GENE.c14092_g1_i2~~c14092_g1_i2.p1  ORF type:complete len:152 (+),score=18.44 c14092_g1_i2:213-668(+)
MFRSVSTHSTVSQGLTCRGIPIHFAPVSLRCFSKWFLEKLGHEGLNNLLAAYDDKSAYAQCIFAYCEGPGHEPILFDGRTEGRIVPARGPNSFGWDPVFEVAEYGQTYAEMDKDLKNTLSHRSRALAKLAEFLLAQFAENPSKKHKSDAAN